MKRLAVITTMILIALASFGTVANASTKVSPKVRHWYLHEGGKRDFKLLAGDLKRIGNDFRVLANESSQSAAVTEAGVLGKACQATDRHLVKVNVQLKPVPNKKLERRWSKALKDIKNGSANCVSGTAALNSSLLNRAGSQFNAAIGIFKSLKF